MSDDELKRLEGEERAQWKMMEAAEHAFLTARERWHDIHVKLRAELEQRRIDELVERRIVAKASGASGGA